MRTSITNQSYLRHIANGGNWDSWIQSAGRDDTEAAIALNPGNGCVNTDHYREAQAAADKRREEMGFGSRWEE